MGGFGVHEYFEDSDSEYIAVDHGHLRDGPVWGVFRYYGIDLGAVGKYSVDEFLGKGVGGLCEGGSVEAGLECMVGFVVGAVDFVEDLHGGDARLAPHGGLGGWAGHGCGGVGVHGVC